MWDLTIPGNHDFYIATANVDVLVHNCGGAPAMSQMERVGSGLKEDAYHRSTSSYVLTYGLSPCESLRLMRNASAVRT